MFELWAHNDVVRKANNGNVKKLMGCKTKKTQGNEEDEGRRRN